MTEAATSILERERTTRGRRRSASHQEPGRWCSPALPATSAPTVPVTCGPSPRSRSARRACLLRRPAGPSQDPQPGSACSRPTVWWGSFMGATSPPALRRIGRPGPLSSRNSLTVGGVGYLAAAPNFIALLPRDIDGCGPTTLTHRDTGSVSPKRDPTDLLSRFDSHPDRLGLLVSLAAGHGHFASRGLNAPRREVYSDLASQRRRAYLVSSEACFSIKQRWTCSRPRQGSVPSLEVISKERTT